MSETTLKWAKKTRLSSWMDGNKSKVDFFEEIDKFLRKNPKSKIYVGTDSVYRKNKWGWSCTYLTVVALDSGLRKGCSLLFRKENVMGENKLDLFTRLWHEVESVIIVAKEIKDKVEVIPEVHLDLNPDENYQSNILYKAAIGYVVGEGFIAKGKPESPVASCAADHFLREGY